MSHVLRSHSSHFSQRYATTLGAQDNSTASKHETERKCADPRDAAIFLRSRSRLYFKHSTRRANGNQLNFCYRLRIEVTRGSLFNRTIIRIVARKIKEYVIFIFP